MLVIPAVDIRYGSCVRLLRGDPAQATVYSKDPIEMAHLWAKRGATRLHVVDLDGALTGQMHNLDIVSKMKKEVPVWIQFGGGIRRWEDVRRCLDAGIDRIIMGTAVFENPELIRLARDNYGERIMVALDVSGDHIAVEGWRESTPMTLREGIAETEELGIREMIFTDINKDGTLEGPNIDAVKKVVGLTKLRVYASGGISSIKDIEQLKTTGVAGCVIGKALYSESFSLEAALDAAKE